MPFQARVEIVRVVLDQESSVADISLLDRSFFGHEFYMRPNGSPLLTMVDSSGFRSYEHSTSADWRRLQSREMHFQTESLESMHLPVSLYLAVRSRFTNAETFLEIKVSDQHGQQKNRDKVPGTEKSD